MTDREMLVGLFNAIGVLTERLTGEIPMLCIGDGQGNIHHIYPNTSNVTWINLKAGAVSQPDGHGVLHSICCSLHGEPDATRTEPQQSVELLANYQG